MNSSASQALLIGIDFGTDSVRALLTDSLGRELASSVSYYRRWAQGLYCDPAANSYRQHPLDYLESLTECVTQVMQGQDKNRVRGLAVDTTGSTPCIVGKDGKVLALDEKFSDNPNAMFVLWKDHSAAEEARLINRCASEYTTDYRKYSGGCYSSEWFWSKLLHILKSDQAVAGCAGGFIEHCDWIVNELAGVPYNCICRSRCAAGHKAMWHPEWNGLPPEEFLAYIAPELKNFRSMLAANTVTADQPTGKLTPQWAERLNLTTDVVVGGGNIDCHTGAVGAGIAPGRMVKVMGTSTCDIITVPQISGTLPGICGQVVGSVLPDMIGLEAGQSAFGDIFSWYRRLLSWNGSDTELAALEKAAAGLPVDAHAPVVLDWFNGRRTPYDNAQLQGGIYGLTLGVSAPRLYRSIIEGALMGSRAIYEHFCQHNVKIDEIIAVGGICKKSPLVMQIYADMINKPVKVAASDQACALGAAIFAAVAAKVYPDVATASKYMASPVAAEYTPNAANQAAYDQLYRRYCQFALQAEKFTV